MLGAIAGTLYYNCNRYGTKQTPPKAPIWVMPSHLKCELSRSNPCTYSRLTLSFRHRVLNSVVLEGKSRVTPRYPREVLRRDDMEGTTDILVYLDYDRCP